MGYFQGREKRVIILSSVRTGDAESSSSKGGYAKRGPSSNGPPHAASNIGFVGGRLGARRVNVSISRARDGLIVLGCFQRTLSKDRGWMKVLKRAARLGAIVQ